MPHSIAFITSRATVVAVAVSLLLLIGGDGRSHATAAAAAAAVPVHVGVILDLATALGKKSLLSLEMALEDFYAEHPDYTTRVRLHVRDSDRDVVTAADKALDLIDNEKASIVIGPQNTLQAEFITYLANKSKVPVISFSATGDDVTQYHVPYFLRACAKDSFQAASIAAFVDAYGWKNVVIVYEDNSYGVGILPSITDALQNVEAHVINRFSIPAYSSDDRIDKELYKLMTMQTRVFIVHMLPAHASHFFSRASAIGMMTEGYVWIVTGNVGIVLDVLPRDIIKTMQGVVGFRPYVAQTARVIDFMAQFVERYRSKSHQDLDLRMLRPTVFEYWAYDVAWAVAAAAEKIKMVRSSNFGFHKRQYIGTDLVEDLQASPAGPELLSFILEADFDGLAGRFRFIDRHMQIPVYEVVNVVGEKGRAIGFWSPGSGLSRLPSSSTTQDKAKSIPSTSEVMKHVIWPGNSTIVPKGWVFPVNAKILRIGVPKRHDFKNFVNIETNPSTNRSIVSGYSIDVFEAAVKRLPYALRYEYIPYDCASSYDQLIYQVFSKNFDAAVGDVTIIANRTRYVDFTMPYTESGVSMLVLAKNDNRKTLWMFLEPLTKDLLITTTFFIFLTGLVVWMIEYPTNNKSLGRPGKEQFNNVFYFTFSTLTFSHEHIIKSLYSKVVVVLWCFVVLVLVQSYTASLSSLLTARRLQPSVTDLRQLLHNRDHVGYQNGSFVSAVLRRHKFDEHNIKVLSSLEGYAEALRKGSKNGGVSAIFDEIPYLNIFLTQYGEEFKIVGPVDRTNGFGFVFPLGSPLVPDLSKAILNFTEDPEGLRVHDYWFGSPDYGTPNTDSGRLSSRSLGGLFIINGIVLAIMLLVHFPNFIRAYRSGETVGENDDPQQTHDGMTTDAVPAESHQVETAGGNEPAFQNGVATEPVPPESLQVEMKAH